MSPAQVSSFVHDLVEMAQAMEKVPSLEAQVEDLTRQRDASQAHSQGLELSIIRYKDEIEGLNGRVHAAEVARDDAEYRFLEVDEKSNKVLSLLASITRDVEAARVALDPPKAEEVKEQVDPTVAETRTSPSELASTDQTPTPPAAGNVDSAGFAHDTQGDTHQPQEKPRPYDYVDNDGQGRRYSEEPQQSYEEAHPKALEPLGPYSDHNYYDHAVYVPREAWLEGGGTDESYDWRPASIKPSSSY